MDTSFSGNNSGGGDSRSETQVCLRVLPWDEIAAAAPAIPEPGTAMTPEGAMALAQSMAWQGLGHASPNPLVGAVVVDREHKFIGAGAHHEVGGPHAEVAAIAHAAELGLAERVAGGSIYVTLEPCSHTGRTPPCVDLLIRSGLGTVIFASIDPNPSVQGQGIVRLKDAGITCVADAKWDVAATRQILDVFALRILLGRPMVALKVATAADGGMARRGARRSWITSERARAYGHFLRLYYDAVAVGAETLVLDDPRLDTRLAVVPERLHRQPWKIVLDPRLRAARSWFTGDESRTQPTEGRAAPAHFVPRVIQRAAERCVWACSEEHGSPHVEDALRQHGVQVVQVARDDGDELSPVDLLEKLSSLGIHSLLLEGGAGLYGPFLRRNLVDKAHVFTSTRTLSLGTPDRRWTSGLGDLHDAPVTLTESSVTVFPTEILLEGYLHPWSLDE